MDLKPEDIFDSTEDLELAKRMLRAVVEFDSLHVNSISIEAAVSGKFIYFIGLQAGHHGAFFPRTVYPRNLKGQLQALGFLMPDRRPGAPRERVAFTETAKDWYRRQAQQASMVTAHDIQRAIGERLYVRRRPGPDAGPIDLDALAETLDVSRERIDEQLANMHELRFIRTAFSIYEPGTGRSSQSGPGDLHLSKEKGLRWAMRGYPPIEEFDAPAVNVTVDLTINITHFLADLRAADADPETKQEATEIVANIQANPTVDEVSKLMGLGANTYTLAAPVVRFFTENGEKILRAFEQLPM